MRHDQLIFIFQAVKKCSIPFMQSFGYQLGWREGHDKNMVFAKTNPK